MKNLKTLKQFADEFIVKVCLARPGPSTQALHDLYNNAGVMRGAYLFNSTNH